MSKKINYSKLAIALLYCAALLLMSYLFAIERVSTCDYNSINGDFQSYNVFRRLLSGQTLFVDFANYIGMAPVLVNMPFMIFGGTFYNSLFVTTLTTNILFCISVFILFYLITKSLAFSCVVSALLPKIIASQMLNLVLGPQYGATITQRFEGLYTPSNSMRGVRAFLPFLLVGASILICDIVKRRKGTAPNLISSLKNIYLLIALGLLQGAFIIWSNDYGVACIAASLFVLIILQMFAHKMKILQFVRNIAAYILCCGVGLLVATTIVTKGQPMAWFSATAQTAEFQIFYFNGTAGKAILPYLLTCTSFWVYTGILCVLMLFCLYLLIKGKADNSILLLVFLGLSIVAATLIYICGGSGYNFKEALEVYCILTLIALLARGAFALLHKHERPMQIILLVVLCATVGYYALLAIRTPPSPTGKYIEELGGYSTYNKALTEAALLTDGEEVFSMYATGLEVVKERFQPTGYDYIIHALGTQTQENYAQKFIEGKYKYVQTPSMPVGIWLANQNWYLYRHLLRGYERVYQTEYSWIWQKADIAPINNDIEIIINRVNSQTVEIICTSANKDTFVADVQISYDTRFKNALATINSLGRKFVNASTTSCVDSDEYYNVSLVESGQGYIPIRMINGEGKAVLRGALGNGIELNVHSAKVIACVNGYMVQE